MVGRTTMLMQFAQYTRGRVWDVVMAMAEPQQIKQSQVANLHFSQAFMHAKALAARIGALKR